METPEERLKKLRMRWHGQSYTEKKIESQLITVQNNTLKTNNVEVNSRTNYMYKLQGETVREMKQLTTWYVNVGN